MPEQIDLEVCEAAMARAVEIAATSARHGELGFVDWSRRVRRFSETCAKTGLKSYVAMLGTALLAKATNSRVDVFSLKAGDESPGAYDARRPAEKVLVPASQAHRFSLATSGPQPLNNQPFFREYRITPSMTVRGHARPVLGELVQLLHEIQQYRCEEATIALAAFVHVRREYVPIYQVSEGTLAITSAEQLAAAIEQLSRARSEGGGRAQACVGGLMDAWFGAARVRVGKKNEPDRHMPGDVGIRAFENSPEFNRVIEVRDKSVPPHAALAFVTKVAEAGVGRGALVAIAEDQEALDPAPLRERAREVGVDLQVFISWADLVHAVLFAADQRETPILEAAVAAIRERLIQLELSVEAIRQWDKLTLRGAHERAMD